MKVFPRITKFLKPTLPKAFAFNTKIRTTDVSAKEYLSSRKLHIPEEFYVNPKARYYRLDSTLGMVDEYVAKIDSNMGSQLDTDEIMNILGSLDSHNSSVRLLDKDQLLQLQRDVGKLVNNMNEWRYLDQVVAFSLLNKFFEKEFLDGVQQYAMKYWVSTSSSKRSSVIDLMNQTGYVAPFMADFLEERAREALREFQPLETVIQDLSLVTLSRNVSSNISQELNQRLVGLKSFRKMFSDLAVQLLNTFASRGVTSPWVLNQLQLYFSRNVSILTEATVLQQLEHGYYVNWESEKYLFNVADEIEENIYMYQEENLVKFLHQLSVKDTPIVESTILAIEKRLGKNLDTVRPNHLIECLATFGAFNTGRDKFYVAASKVLAGCQLDFDRLHLAMALRGFTTRIDITDEIVKEYFEEWIIQLEDYAEITKEEMTYILPTVANMINHIETYPLISESMVKELKKRLLVLAEESEGGDLVDLARAALVTKLKLPEFWQLIRKSLTEVLGSSKYRRHYYDLLRFALASGEIEIGEVIQEFAKAVSENQVGFKTIERVEFVLREFKSEFPDSFNTVFEAKETLKGSKTVAFVF